MPRGASSRDAEPIWNLLRDPDAVVLGVDLGKVGFLTEVACSDVEAALEAVHHGGATIEERMTLTMRASRPLEIPAGIESLLRYGHGPKLPPPTVRHEASDADGWGVALDVTALNDVVLEKLARDLDAKLLIILTDVDAVYVDYGKPTQRRLERLTADEAERLDAAGTFGEGSMGPKVRAAIEFVRRTHGRAVITELSRGRDAVRGEAGTTITAETQ